VEAILPARACATKVNSRALHLAVSIAPTRFKSFATGSSGVLNQCRRGNSKRISKSEFRFILRAYAAFAKPGLFSFDLNSGIAPPWRKLTVD
jgi:hypothetical protein